MTSRQQLVSVIVQNLSTMRRLMFQQGHAFQGDGPTHAQLGLMFALSHQEDLSMKALAKCFGMTSSAATQLMTGLVSRGWVTRKTVAGDRRKVSLRLSPSGKRVLKNVMTKRTAVFAKHLEALTDSELKQWKTLQEKIIAHQQTYEGTS